VKRLVLLLLVLAVTSLQAASYTKYEQITVANAVKTLTVINYFSGGQQIATVVSCRLQDAEIRWTIDGSTPTTTVGTMLEPLETLILSDVAAMSAFQAIRTGATSGILNCTYSKP
jgi:hypothetical protein